MEGIKEGVIPWKMLTYSEKKKRRTRHSLLWFFKWVNSLNGVKLKRKCHSVNVFQQDLVLIVAVMNLKWVWTLRLNFNHMTECFILSCLRLFFLLGRPSITRKHDGRVHEFSLLWMLPKMFQKHPSSVKVTDDDTRVKTMASVEQAVAKQRMRNVLLNQSEPVVPLPEPGEQNSEASEANSPEEEEEDTINRLGNTDCWVSHYWNSSQSYTLLTSSVPAVVLVALCV